MKQKTENRKPITSQLFGVPISITSKSQALALVEEWLRKYRSVISYQFSVLGSKSIGFQLAGPKPINRKQTNQKQKTLPDFAWTKSRRAGENRKPITGDFPKIITTPNPEMIVAAQTDPEFLKALQSADLAIPDGIGIIWALKLLGSRFSVLGSRLQVSRFSVNRSNTGKPKTDNRFPSRLSGLDLMESLIREPQKVGPFELKVMLLGGKPGVAERVVASLRRKLETRNSKFETDPNDQNSKSKTVSNLENWDLEFVSDFDIRISDLQIRAISGPKDIAEASKEELDELLNSINHFRPDLLFVAFGHGKQEKWLAANRHRLNAGVAMGVGGALDQIADPSLRPPAYINSIGLGWLYRLLREPRRWKRQLALVKFVGMVLGKKFEARNSKLETNSNFQNPNAQNQQF